MPSRLAACFPVSLRELRLPPHQWLTTGSNGSSQFWECNCVSRQTCWMEWWRSPPPASRRLATFTTKFQIVFPIRQSSSAQDSRGAETLRLVISRSEEHTSELQSHSDLVCRL